MNPAQLRELEERATPATWEVGDPSVFDAWVAIDGYGISSVVGFDGHGNEEYDEANIRFIVALRNIAPKLIALWGAAEEWSENGASAYIKLVEAVRALRE